VEINKIYNRASLSVISKLLG